MAALRACGVHAVGMLRVRVKRDVEGQGCGRWRVTRQGQEQESRWIGV